MITASLEELLHAAGGLPAEQLRAVIDQLPVAVAIVEAPSGRKIVANDLNAQIFRQRSPEAAAGVAGYKAYVGFRADGTELSPTDWPLSRSIRTGEVVRGEEVEIVRGDGTHAFIRISSGPVRDASGRIVAGVVIYDDVTEAKRAHDIIRFMAEVSKTLSSSLDYETTLRAVAQIAVPKLADWCSIDLLTQEGKLAEQLAVAHVDPAKVALAREWRKKYPPDMSAPRGVPRVLREGVPEVYREIPDEMLVAAIGNDPERLRITRELGLKSAITVPLLIRGKAIGAMSLISAESGRLFDDNDVKMAQEVAARAALAIENARLYDESQAAVRLREDFLSVASHELRTPLHTLHLQVSALLLANERNPEAAPPRAKLERLMHQLERMTGLVDNLLDVSRLVGGKLVLTKTSVDLAALVREVVARFHDDTARDKITVTVNGDAHGEWDNERLDQVVTNLLSNAVKYGKGAPIDIVVDGRARGAVTLTVKDRGVGISPEDQRRIFEKFERASSTRHFAGLGLGLFIVQQVVVAHGGDISVSSAPGAGAEFSLRLPRA